MPRSEARRLLRESRAYLVRWFTRTSDEPTAFWYVLCDCYDFDSLSRKTRNQIRTANRECAVRSVDAEWVAANGYDCYQAAFGRYKHGGPISRDYFARIQRSCVGGPFAFWGAFVGTALAGFAKCVIVNDYVALVAFRFDPAQKKSLPTYALLDSLLRTYVAEQRKTLGNGFLALHDDSEMQEFLLKFGFRRVYCDLQVVYRPALAAVLRALYPFRQLIDRLPPRPLAISLKSLLRQEQVRRTCDLASPHTLLSGTAMPGRDRMGY